MTDRNAEAIKLLSEAIAELAYRSANTIGTDSTTYVLNKVNEALEQLNGGHE